MAQQAASADIDAIIAKGNTPFHMLNRKKPFGEIHGVHDGEARFEQNGFLYSASGVLIAEALSGEQKEKLKKLIVRAAAEAAAEARRREVLAELGEDDDEIDANERDERRQKIEKEAKSPNFNADDIDLEKWAKDEVSYPFDKVAAAIRAKHHKQVTKFVDAIGFIAEEYKIPVDLLRRK